MAINIESLPVGIYMQSGNGVPTHISPKGTEYTDLDTAIVYINKDGVATWAEFLDSTFVFTGGTSSYFTGGTVTGPTNFLNGVTANTISATTYYGLPTDVRVTGGTYSSGTILFTNNTGGTFTVTGLTTGSSSTTVIQFTGGTVTGATIFTGGLSANTISATTYQNLPNDLPPSGTTGQILSKIDNVDYNVEWIDNYASQLKHEVKAGAAINKGQAVYVSSASGTNMVVSKADYLSETTSSKTMGLLMQNLSTNGIGFVITEGLLTGTGAEPLNTNAGNAGDPVWLGANGDLIFGLTNKPIAPLHLVFIGIITRKSTTVGEIFVKVQNGFELDELHTVRLTGKTYGDLLTYSAYNGSDVWVNSKTLNGSYIITGNTTVGGSMNSTTISATTYLNLPTDIRVTGGTYSSGTTTFTNNTGGTFNITGFSTGNVVSTGSTNFIPKFTGSNGIGDSIMYDAGYGIGIGTTVPNTMLGLRANYSFSNLVDLQNTASNGGSGVDMYDNLGNYMGYIGGELGHKSIGLDSYATSGISFSISSNKQAVITSTGLGLNVLQPTAKLHVSGTTLINGGLTANTISATTYLNLPTDVRVTGGTYSSGTATFTNNTGGTFSVTGLTTPFTGGTVTGATNFTNGLTANTISATTYFNLPTTADTFTTGFSYSNNTLTLNRNQGLSALTTSINTMTGLTINGNITVTGTTTLSGLTGSTNRMVEVSSSGIISANSNIITGYITSGGTVSNLLENVSNWDIDGNYTGTTITGTYQGQKHYNQNYLFEAVADNVFIRLIRG